MLTSTASSFINVKLRTAACGFSPLFSWLSKLLQHLAQGYPGVLYRFFPIIFSSILFWITPTNSLLFSGDRKGRPAKRILHSPERTTPSVSFAYSSLWEWALSLSHFQQIEQHTSVAVDLATSPFSPTCSIKFWVAIFIFSFKKRIFKPYQNGSSKKSCRPKIGLVSKTDTTKMPFFENRLLRTPKNAITKPFTAISSLVILTTHKMVPKLLWINTAFFEFLASFVTIIERQIQLFFFNCKAWVISLVHNVNFFSFS